MNQSNLIWRFCWDLHQVVMLKHDGRGLSGHWDSQLLLATMYVLTGALGTAFDPLQITVMVIVSALCMISFHGRLNSLVFMCGIASNLLGLPLYLLHIQYAPLLVAIMLGVMLSFATLRYLIAVERGRDE